MIAAATFNDVLRVGILVLPWLPVVAALMSWVLKALRAHIGAKRVDRNAFAWEGPVLAISLTTALISMQLALEAEERQKLFKQLDRVTTEVNDAGLAVFKGTHQAALEAVKRDIQETREGYDKSSQSVTILRFHPAGNPSASLVGDPIIDDVFRQLGFRLNYIVGYIPSGSSSGGEIDARRKAMQLYLFRLLTSAQWDKPEFLGVRREFTVRVVPEYRASDILLIKSPVVQKGWMFFFDSTPIDVAAARGPYAPLPQAISTVAQSNITRSMDYDSLLIANKATEYLERQLALPDYQREPFTIFAETDAVDGLRPMSVNELREKVSKREKSWQLNTESKTPSVQLNELKDILRQM